MKITATCPIPGILWVEFPDTDFMVIHRMMLKLRREYPGMVINHIASRFLYLHPRGA